MNDIQKAILEARSKQRELITKGFEPQDDSTIEKAKWNPGDIHPNGKWVFTEYKPGKFDWRNIKSTGAQSKPAAATQSKPDVAKQLDYKGVTIHASVDKTGGQETIVYQAPEVSNKKYWDLNALKKQIDSKKHDEDDSNAKKKDEEKGYKKGSFVTYEIANIPHEGRVVSVDKDGKYANVRNLAGDLNYISVKKLKSATEAEQKSIETKFKSRKYADGKTYNAEFEDSESTSDSKAEEQKKIEDKKGEKLNSLMEKYDGLPEKIKDNYKKVLSSIQEEGSKFYNFIKDLNDTSSGKLFIRPSDTRNSLEIMEVSSSFYSRQDGDAGDRKVESAFSNFDKVLKKHGVKTSVEYETAAGSYGGKGYISLDELKKLTSK